MTIPDGSLPILRVITIGFMFTVATLVAVTFMIPAPPPEDTHFRIAMSLLVLGFVAITVAAGIAPKLLESAPTPTAHINRAIFLLALREAGVIMGFVATVLTGDKSYLLALALVALLEMGRSWPRSSGQLK